MVIRFFCSSRKPKEYYYTANSIGTRQNLTSRRLRIISTSIEMKNKITVKNRCTGIIIHFACRFLYYITIIGFSMREI